MRNNLKIEEIVTNISFDRTSVVPVFRIDIANYLIAMGYQVIQIQKPSTDGKLHFMFKDEGEIKKDIYRVAAYLHEQRNEIIERQYGLNSEPTEVSVDEKGV